MTEDSLVKSIKQTSALVDNQFISTPSENFTHYLLSLPAPSHHPRAAAIQATEFVVKPFVLDDFPDNNTYFILSPSMKTSFIASMLGERAHFVNSRESTLKEISWLDRFINHEVPNNIDTIVGIGGGILLNAAAYIAEKRKVDFISVPTTILAAADGAIGGLVRINKVTGNKFQKSFYKSVYEPSEIIVDIRFFATLPHTQISFGLSEVIKHGVYQSLPLLKYVASKEFEPFVQQNSLLKAICWTAALKNVVIEYDPDSVSFGGNILRGGHKMALKIEEQSQFRISHGEAVAVSIYQDAKDNTEIIKLLDVIYQKLNLPKTNFFYFSS